MKRNLTRISRKQLLSRVGVGACSVLAVLATPIQMANIAYADQFEEQIRVIQGEVDALQGKAGELNQKADSLKQAIASLKTEQRMIQAQIELSQAKFDKLSSDIAENKEKLKQNQAALGEMFADLYVDDEVSPLEMIASSKNVSDYMDKQEYRTAVSERLNSTISSVKELKKQLEDDQKKVKRVLADQASQKKAKAAKEAQQKRLLKQTKGKEAAYRKQISQKKANMADIAAQQQAAFQRVTGGGVNNSGVVGQFQFKNFSGNLGCAGGYPSKWCGVQDTVVDKWGLFNRECVSYTAWAASERFGKQVYNFAGRGNAGDWPATASSSMGATVNNTPKVGAVAILPPTAGFAPIGHSMLVEEIKGGGWVRVSQYNFGGSGQYSTMDIASSGVVFVHFR